MTAFRLHIHRGFLAEARPTDALALILRTTHATAHSIIVRGVYNDLRITEQLQFLHAFLVHITEILLMGTTQRCQHTYRGLNDVVKRQHLARLTDTCLEERHLCLLVQQPHAQGHTQLRVVALGRTGHLHRRHQNLVEPLLHPRLTVRPRNTHHRNIKLITMTLSQSLQGCQR